ncbi:MAG: UDP-glucose/GDP-mannose dehydrogenase family protein [Deltaproteobacteria bacterium]|nr:MAG: UDP-glucose/GDP-mannose dehydrogenase family protein [Deltaproteobacteria bacterium]
MNVVVVGTGYVGLVTAAGLAEMGASVVAIDVDAARITSLRAGRLPMHEPGLAELVSRGCSQTTLSFSTDLAGAVAEAEVVFVAVGTPSQEDGAVDLGAVEEVSEGVAQVARRELVLVLKSTVPVGTNQRIRARVAQARVPIHVVSNPEFLREGAAVQDVLTPDRIVVGCEPTDTFARRVMERLYQPFMLQNRRILWMDPKSAELTKYAANTMLALRISFMNEVASLCEELGADIHQVRAGIGSDPRIGERYLHAGPGFGGSCLPKDVAALARMARELGVGGELASAAQRVNRRQRGLLVQKLRRRFPEGLGGRVVAIWGLAFKPNTDDIREAPALDLLDALVDAGAQVVAHDPAAMPRVRQRVGRAVRLVDRPMDAVIGAHALVLVTEWRCYRSPDFRTMREAMARPYLLDGRNLWSSLGLSRLGFEYEGIGSASDGWIQDGPGPASRATRG